MAKTEEKKKSNSPVVVLSDTTKFEGFLRFKETLCIQGQFKGTIEADGALIIDKGAIIEANQIKVTSLTVYGIVVSPVEAVDKIDLLPGATVKGDLTAARLRIADGVLFEGQCNMTGTDRSVEIFSRSTQEIKAELQNNNEQLKMDS
ncbi:MAG: polymer-forming cytoskeletal protein [Spirochaetaceae bacterium]|jgi:cytoskeletal protein CcmA (bactofilin family)|nr:polymer-forming cytoskeletal protein [Spirochaetaceae bacterium]